MMTAKEKSDTSEPVARSYDDDRVRPDPEAERLEAERQAAEAEHTRRAKQWLEDPDSEYTDLLDLDDQPAGY